MQKNISLKLLPSEAADEQVLKGYIARTEAIDPSAISGFNILKWSVDARGKQAWVNLQVKAFIHEPYQQRERLHFNFKDVSTSSRQVIIVGAGPAGLFAALKLLEAGIKPVILERGKDVRSRRRDLARLNKEGLINPESNYCFGEGGAGTYSDGKLYTRSSKRGDVHRVLQLFVLFGADERILYESHPHIGTNKLPHIITAIRQEIINKGGKFLFDKKVTDLVIEAGTVKAVQTSDGNRFEGDAVILATGHSARDIFRLLVNKNILVHAKPFALGVRVEHPQSLIDSSQYHCDLRDNHLPPASYSLVQQVEGKGVFSFCMCPGGIIAPASTDNGELVVNGWSPSRRNNPFANSGIVVTVEEKDARDHLKHIGSIEGTINDALVMMQFQQHVEQLAFKAGGGKFVGPAQRLVDFTESKLSATLPPSSYLPGLHSTELKDVLPYFIHKRLQQAFREFGRKMKGYLTNEAVLVATESRTSSPVRIPRDPLTLQHSQVRNLYPCGEGAGYAGGIVSAAMDGERVVDEISRVLK